MSARPAPRTSIFDKTLPGFALPDEVPASGVEMASEPSPILRAQTRVFDKTLPGLLSDPKARKRRFWSKFFGQKEAAVSEVPVRPEDAYRTIQMDLPPLPRTRVFDATFPGIPSTHPAPPAAKDLPIVSSHGVSPAPKPIHEDDAVAWDEGTAAEWNPRWSSGAAETPKPALAPFLKRMHGRRFLWVMGACLTILAAGALLQLNHGPKVHAAPPKQVPTVLQAYLAKAEGGDAAAMRMLGVCYCYGIASPADWQEGTRWLRRAAKAGNATARLELASMGIAAD